MKILGKGIKIVSWLREHSLYLWICSYRGYFSNKSIWRVLGVQCSKQTGIYELKSLDFSPIDIDAYFQKTA